MEKIIYIVSGIPRSGTSMMMKMLKEGGLPVYFNTPVEGNEFNPDGYFETTYIRKINIYHGWIENAYGKGLKVFAQKLKELPDNNFGDITYKIIFMERNPVASAQSYARMRGIEVTDTEQEIEAKYTEIKEKTDSLVEKKGNIEMIYINYDELIDNPQPKCQEIKDFLGVDLDINKMVAIPDINRKHF